MSNKIRWKAIGVLGAGAIISMYCIYAVVSTPPNDINAHLVIENNILTLQLYGNQRRKCDVSVDVFDKEQCGIYEEYGRKVEVSGISEGYFLFGDPNTLYYTYSYATKDGATLDELRKALENGIYARIRIMSKDEILGGNRYTYLYTNILRNDDPKLSNGSGDWGTKYKIPPRTYTKEEWIKEQKEDHKRFIESRSWGPIFALACTALDHVSVYPFHGKYNIDLFADVWNKSHSKCYVDTKDLKLGIKNGDTYTLLEYNTTDSIEAKPKTMVGLLK